MPQSGFDRLTVLIVVLTVCEDDTTTRLGDHASIGANAVVLQGVPDATILSILPIAPSCSARALHGNGGFMRTCRCNIAWHIVGQVLGQACIGSVICRLIWLITYPAWRLVHASIVLSPMRRMFCFMFGVISRSRHWGTEVGCIVVSVSTQRCGLWRIATSYCVQPTSLSAPTWLCARKCQWCM